MVIKVDEMKIFTGLTEPCLQYQPRPKNFVTRMVTCNLFVVANLVVSDSFMIDSVSRR